MRGSLFHHLQTPAFAPRALVRRSSLRRLFAEIAKTTLDVEGSETVTNKQGLSFSRVATQIDRFQVRLVGTGFVIDPGNVFGLTLTGDGSYFYMPKIDGVRLDAETAPVLDPRVDDVICVELKVQFFRGPDVPYASVAELEEWPAIKWRSDISPQIGEISSSESSHGVFAYPLARIDARGGVTQLVATDILITPRITSLF